MIDCIMTDIPKLVRSRIELGGSWRAAKLGDLVDRLCYRGIKHPVTAIYCGMTDAGALVPWVTALGEDGLKLEWKEGRRAFHVEARPDGVRYWGSTNKRTSKVLRSDDVAIDIGKYTAWLLKEVATDE